MKLRWLARCSLPAVQPGSAARGLGTPDLTPDPQRGGSEGRGSPVHLLPTQGGSADWLSHGRAALPASSGRALAAQVTAAEEQVLPTREMKLKYRSCRSLCCSIERLVCFGTHGRVTVPRKIAPEARSRVCTAGSQCPGRSLQRPGVVCARGGLSAHEDHSGDQESCVHGGVSVPRKIAPEARSRVCTAGSQCPGRSLRRPGVMCARRGLSSQDRTYSLTLIALSSPRTPQCQGYKDPAHSSPGL